MLNKIKGAREAYKMKKQLEEEKVSGEGYHGKIKLKMNGAQEIESLEIDEEILEAKNKSMIEQEIVKAYKDATKKLQKAMLQKVQSGEISLPF